VDKASGQRSAAAQYEAYQDIVFPLFFIWESGFQEVLAHHLPLIFAETIFGRVFTHALELINKKLPKVVSDATVPPSSDERDLSLLELSAQDVDDFMATIRDDDHIQHEAVAIARTSRPADSLLTTDAQAKPPQLSPRTYLSPDVVGAVRGAVIQATVGSGTPSTSVDALPFGIGAAIQGAWAIAKAAVPVIVNCFKRFQNQRDHGLPCTIVEEVLRALYMANFGSSIWEEMKRETEDAFGMDSSAFGGTAVIEELCALVKQKPEIRITLVGHSTGGVYIGNFLRHVDSALSAQGDTSTLFDIILMAPANTNDFFLATYQDRISGIRIFQMNDPTEQQDHLMSRDVGPEDSSILGKIYPRSLLYLVSGVCEYFEGQGGSGPHVFDGQDMPLLGMDRFPSQPLVFGSKTYVSVQQVRDQFSVSPPPPPTKYVRVLSPTDPAASTGYRSSAKKHGDFPRDAETIASLRECFQRGL
jgi:hypothetical protein